VNKTPITDSRQPIFELIFSYGNANRTPATASGQPSSWPITSKYGETWIFRFLRNHFKWITETRIYGDVEIYIKLILLLF
jgi:hypothetical protein